MSGNKVLIVEDELITALSLSEMLKISGFEVCDPMSTGEGTLRAVDEISPAIILMDVRLDGNLDGLKTAEKIRKKSKIPIIFMTGYDDEEMLQQMSKIINSRRVCKPINVFELMLSINEMI